MPWQSAAIIDPSGSGRQVLAASSQREAHMDPPNAADMEPYRQSVEAVVAALGTDARAGLSQDQAQERLGRYGSNELAAEAPVSGWRKFIAQFTDALVVLLMIAGAISAGLWLYERDSAAPYEALAIFAIV